MKNLILNKRNYYCFLVLVLVVSCSKMDDYKRDFTNNKELVYAGKADSLKLHSGKNRLMLSWLLTADPSITKAKIYWNNRVDSAELIINRSSQVDTINYLLNNLDEGMYSFEVFTFDDLNNRSVAAYVNGRVYGANYESTLLNRELNKAQLHPNGSMEIHWSSVEQHSVGVEVIYTNQQGVPSFQILAPDQEVSVLNSYKKGSTFKYRTLFLPDTLALDTFYSAYKTINVLELLDKSRFRDVTFPGDAPIVGEPNYQKSNLWDDYWSNNFNEPYGNYTSALTTGGDGVSPQHMTIDLGGVFEIENIWLKHYHPFLDRSPRRYEIWGATNPSIDKVWEGWTKYATFEQVKPSGMPEGQYSEEDKKVWIDGDIISLGANSVPIRYLRIRCLENWGGLGFWAGSTNFTLSEISLTGRELQ